MRATVPWWFRAVFVLSVATLVVGAGSALAAEDSPYAGAEKCGPCHKAIYQAWAETKHAKALGKLQPAERQKDCIGCHVTGSPEMIAADGDNPTFPNVQCEACHGPAGAHAQNPTVRTGLIAKPGESDCTRCHNAKSPRFRGFVFSAMKLFVHQVK
jgi:Cytochrome c554 and c-prime